MRVTALLGAVLLAGVELAALMLGQRQFAPAAAGVATALLLLGTLRMLAGRDGGPGPGTEPADEPGAALRHWRSSTEAQIHWSESTRRDWDRHWRPILARHFEAAAGQRQAVDPAAFDATGRMLFGDDLWGWVHPGNVTAAGGDRPGPGRAALEEILRRLDRR